MKVLVACEESRRVCIAFRAKGHAAYSCDIESAGQPCWHIKGNVLPLLDGKCKFTTQDGQEHEITDKWGLIIAHPPCTYLTVTGNRWFDTGKYGKAACERNDGGRINARKVDSANGRCKSQGSDDDWKP